MPSLEEDKEILNSMKSFSLDHLDETQFENFCNDLLNEMGFININWRKGTGLSASPSDQGRDIECQFEREDVDGSKYFEKWFVECKHHLKGVNPKELCNVLVWASAEKPDGVLIIVSNFLSNPAKAYLEKYKEKNNPSFRIKYWEKPDIENLTVGKSKLLRKYNISGEFPYLSIMHPAHLLYLRHPQMNTLDFFFEILDSLNNQKREEIMGFGKCLVF